MPLVPRAQAVSSEDSAKVLRAAKILQSRFERIRLQFSPSAKGGTGGDCEEIIGRLCVWNSGRDQWRPGPVSPQITQARVRFLEELDSLGRVIPGDPWILGHRVRYRGETGDWIEAQRVAENCRVADTWWCEALYGYALHRSGNSVAAEAAFESALVHMPSDQAKEWLDPSPLLDPNGERWLRNQPDSMAMVKFLWALADPFFYVAGNDRRTGHFSRWAYAVSNEASRSPHQLPWGKDLTEIAVRFGWPGGWERSWPRPGEVRPNSAVGHDEPGSIPFFPPTEVLEWLTEGERDPSPSPPPSSDWVDPQRIYRSIYIPPYVDSVAALDAQVGRFWGGDGSIRLLAAFRLPLPASPLAIPAPRQLGTGRAGLFVLRPGGLSLRVDGQPDLDGVVRLNGSLPTGAPGFVSLEVLFFADSLGARQRWGVDLGARSPDILSLSDLVLLRPEGNGAESLDAVARVLLPSHVILPDQEFAVAFEVYGLGYRQEEVSFSLRLRRLNKGFFARAGRWFGLGEGGDPLRLTWSEPGPGAPGSVLKTVALRLPDLESGDYELMVVTSTRGRSEVVTATRIVVPVPPVSR